MKINFTFRQMDSSEELKSHTAAKLDRLSRFEETEMLLNVTFSMGRFSKTVEFQATGANGTFVSRETRDDMYEAIDLAIDKIDRQLARAKDKRKHHKGQQATTPDNLDYEPGS